MIYIECWRSLFEYIFVFIVLSFCHIKPEPRALNLKRTQGKHPVISQKLNLSQRYFWCGRLQVIVEEARHSENFIRAFWIIISVFTNQVFDYYHECLSTVVKWYYELTQKILYPRQTLSITVLSGWRSQFGLGIWNTSIVDYSAPPAQ